jgi:hypothetical protein
MSTDPNIQQFWPALRRPMGIALPAVLRDGDMRW